MIGSRPSNPNRNPSIVMSFQPSSLKVRLGAVLALVLSTAVSGWSQSISRDARLIASLCAPKADTSASAQLHLLTHLDRHIQPMVLASANSVLNAMGCAVKVDAKTFGMVHFQTTRISEIGVTTSGSADERVPTGSGPKSVADWQTAAIEGVATFMVERFESELTATAIDGILSTIAKRDSMSRIDSLFPNTTRFAKDMHDNPYHPYSLAYFQSVLHRDIRALPMTALKPGVLFPDSVRMELVSSIDLWNRLMSGDPVENVLVQVAEGVERDFPSEAENARKLRRAAGMLRAFATETGSYHADMGDSLFRMDHRQRNAFTVLMALAMDRPVADSLRNLATAVSDFQNHQSLVRVVARMESDQRTDPHEAARLALELISVLDGNRSKRFLEAKRYVEMVLAMDPNKPGQILETFLTTYGQYAGPQTREGKLLMQLAALAAVKDEDDMADFLTANALPIGGSRIKRQSAFNISLNGYAGVIGGWEHMAGDGAAMVGFSAPVGFSLSWAWNPTKPAKRRSMSVFASVIDLGTLMTARLDSDSTSYSAFRLEHILAPGLGAYYNFQNSPISIGGHFSHVPHLRTVGAGDRKSVTRFTFSVLVDIPMFTIRNRPD